MNHQLAEQLQTAYDHLWQMIDLLDPAEVETAHLETNWTPKALLAHVAFWDDKQRQRLEAALCGDSAQPGFVYPALDNDERAAQDATRPWAEVVTAADTARQQLITFARNLDPAALEQEYPEGERTLAPGASGGIID